jgi:hypothetical protein
MDIKRRWGQHRYGKGSLLLNNAIKKYNITNFTLIILEEVDKTNKSKSEIISILTILEQKWFNLKKPFLRKFGYNIQKTSKPNLTKKRGVKFKKKMSRIMMNKGHNSKAIIQYNLLGERIKEWKSASEVERVLGFNADHIRHCSSKKQNTAHNFIWRYKNYILLDDEVKFINSKLINKKIKQYSLNGEFIKIYNSSKEIFEETGFRRHQITDACSGQIKTAYGFIWLYENQKFNIDNHRNLMVNYTNMPIIQYTKDGEYIKKWSKIKELISIGNFSSYCAKPIYKVCNKKEKLYRGYYWEWGINLFQ